MPRKRISPKEIDTLARYKGVVADPSDVQELRVRLIREGFYGDHRSVSSVGSPGG